MSCHNFLLCFLRGRELELVVVGKCTFLYIEWGCVNGRLWQLDGTYLTRLPLIESLMTETILNNVIWQTEAVWLSIPMLNYSVTVVLYTIAYVGI